MVIWYVAWIVFLHSKAHQSDLHSVNTYTYMMCHSCEAEHCNAPSRVSAEYLTIWTNTSPTRAHRWLCYTHTHTHTGTSLYSTNQSCVQMVRLPKTYLCLHPSGVASFYMTNIQKRMWSERIMCVASGSLRLQEQEKLKPLEKKITGSSHFRK